ncbi:MAG: hypothetical protein DRI90_17155, partial [Deltaproteobacteria bacterium]
MPRRSKKQPTQTSKILSPSQYQRLVDTLSRLLDKGRKRAEEAVGRELVETYHAVGSRLLAQQLSARAGYGTATLQRIADDLTITVRTLQRAIAFARAYPTAPPASGLKWAHYRELLQLPESAQRDWYETEAAAQSWSAPKLRQAVREQRHRNRTTKDPTKRRPKRRKTLRRPSESTYLYKAIIERVVDGDTLLALIDLGFQVHRQQRLRLAAIDTPA